jgi:hypothetical protein
LHISKSTHQATKTLRFKAAFLTWIDDNIILTGITKELPDVFSRN